MADASSPGKFPERKLKALGFTQDFQRSLDDRAAQVAVMIGMLAMSTFAWQVFRYRRTLM